MFSRQSAPIRTLILVAAGLAATVLAKSPAAAESLLLVDVESGKVLHADNATYPWYPASITKIMTAYTTLRAVKEGRITLDKLLVVSHNAAAQSPVKMGFPPGTTVTVDNALKMMMVKSANDIAVVLAEGVGGSIENFADLMNSNAQRLGMTQSHFVNPNGLPADEQVVSARDMAILARALIKEFPEYDYYWHLPGIRLGKMVQRNYNTLIGRYPGADGMKTGFICASGFNLVATATRDGKRLIAVVLGAPSSSARAVKAAQLLERGFSANPLSWLTPSLGAVDALQPVNAAPPNLRDDMCGGHRKRQASEDEDDSAAIASLGSSYSVFLSALRAPNSKQAALLQDAKLGEPVAVWTGAAPKKPGESRTAAVDPKAKAKSPASKESASKTAAKPASPAATGSSPWSNLSPASIAGSPPPELGTKPAGGTGKPAAPKPKATKKAAVSDPKATPPKAAPQKSQEKSKDTSQDKSTPKSTPKSDAKSAAKAAAPKSKASQDAQKTSEKTDKK
jgi:D-alanyl-D-alanine carboxypeptidase